jgi:hypothetical protein
VQVLDGGLDLGGAALFAQDHLGRGALQVIDVGELVSGARVAAHELFDLGVDAGLALVQHQSTGDGIVLGQACVAERSRCGSGFIIQTLTGDPRRIPTKLYLLALLKR